MNIGIVTTWFERGAAYVSKLFEEKLKEQHNVFIYARGGEEYAIGDPKWDKSNVTWGKKIISPFSSTVIDKQDFVRWIKKNKIEVIIFNEQHWFQPLLWCKEYNIKTIAYIDYYTEETIPLFAIYDGVICNTKRHMSVFENHHNAFYIPWGTDIQLFDFTKRELVNEEYVTFFHSCGWDTDRKGTDLLLKSFLNVKSKCKLIIHTQKEIIDKDICNIIEELKERNILELIVKTVPAPGLFHLGDVYVYPSRLEGIGLTIAEALSSGLAIIVPNNAPMNEFVDENKTGRVIEVEKLFSRYDGYYWPKCEINLDHLSNIIDELCSDKEHVIRMKQNSRNYALKNLDINKNFNELFEIVDNVLLNKIDGKLINEINNFDKKGFKRFNKLYLNFYPIFNFIRKYANK